MTLDREKSISFVHHCNRILVQFPRPLILLCFKPFISWAFGKVLASYCLQYLKRLTLPCMLSWLGSAQFIEGPFVLILLSFFWYVQTFSTRGLEAASRLSKKKNTMLDSPCHTSFQNNSRRNLRFPVQVRGCILYQHSARFLRDLLSCTPLSSPLPFSLPNHRPPIDSPTPAICLPPSLQPTSPSLHYSLLQYHPPSSSLHLPSPPWPHKHSPPPPASVSKPSVWKPHHSRPACNAPIQPARCRRECRSGECARC